MDQIFDAVHASSTPGLPKFGQFLSHAEVVAITRNDEALNAVLQHFGKAVDHVSNDGMWIRVSTFDSLVPMHLKKHIDVVVPLNVKKSRRHTSGKKALSRGQTERGLCTEWPSYLLTPQKLKSIYGVQSAVKNNATAAVFETIAESFDGQDLSSFQQLSGLPQANVSHFSGNANATLGCPNYECLEPNTDVQLLMGIASGVDLTYYNFDFSANSILLYLSAVSSDPSPPWVHSISWGPPERHLSPDEANRMNEEFAKNSARGVTFVTSSGDDGVNNRAARTNPNACGLDPQYPAGSPFVLTVGGSFGPEYGQQQRTAQVNVAGMYCSITSGGGFSKWYARPSYQDAVVTSYLKNAPGLPPLSSFNASNRAYPDISLQANFIAFVANQNCWPTGGTSASAPLMAGMLALIADARGGALGLVNPSLYHLAATCPQCITDITVGDNHCTGVQGKAYTCCPQGFNATSGYDPVTGIGVVGSFEMLKQKYLMLFQR